MSRPRNTVLADSKDKVTQTGMLAAAFPEKGSAEDAVNDLHPLKGVGMPQDIAGVAVFPASEDASWVTGVALPVDGGYTAM